MAIISFINGNINKMKTGNKPKTPEQQCLGVLLTKYTYDRESGQVWNTRVNKISSAIGRDGYRVIHVTVPNRVGRLLKVHHVVWFFEYGRWPKSQLDHIDGNKVNNHYSNLRECSGRENTQFFKFKGGVSKFMGVDFHKTAKKFRARIRDENKHRSLGLFTCEIEAARAYDKALVEMGLAPFNITHYKDLMNKKETE
jgi:hypothetical protein